jgi:hypothetical protein
MSIQDHPQTARLPIMALLLAIAPALVGACHRNWQARREQP